MGLLDKLTTGGSNLSKYNGGPGVVNTGATKRLPQPSELDINGTTPATALRDAQTPSINSSFSKGTYKNGAPEGRTF